MASLPLPKTDELQFGDIVIDRASYTVLRDGEKREMTPRAFDVLIYLIENRGRVVEKQELFEQVWKDTFVTDNALMRAVREIRRELGDSATDPKYIETIHKRGYRFIADVGSAKNTEPSILPGPMGDSDAVDHKPQKIDRTAREVTRGTGFISSRSIAAGLALVAIAAAALAIYYLQRDTPIRSIAVMPLENAATGENSEHISDGIAESVINSLSELQEIKVVARATAFRYRGQESDPQRIGRELGVAAILTGRIVQSGDDLTVQTELIDTADGSQIWGSRYSRRVGAVYELPGAIAADIAKKLGLKLTREQEQRLARNYTENNEAYQLYSLGRFFWNKRSEDALNKSIEYFQQAIENDPNYALAYAGLADSYAVAAISADLPAHEVMPKAKAAAEKALELDDGLVEAHATMLRIKAQYEWDLAGAEREYRRAIELNPNYPMTHVYNVSYLVAAGRTGEAVASATRAQELDPLSLIANAVVARALFFDGRYDQAIAQSRKTLEMDDNVFLARLILGRSLARKGDHNAAIAELQRLRQVPGGNSETTSLLAHTLASAGRTAEAGKLLEEMLQLSQKRYVQPYDIAVVHTGLGNIDAAFEWLERAYQDRNHQVPLIGSVPEFESLRKDPRWNGFAARFESRR